MPITAFKNSSRRMVKSAAETLFGPYRVNWIVELGNPKTEPGVPEGIDIRHLQSIGDLDGANVHPTLAKRFSFGGPDADGFGIFDGPTLAGVCWFWSSARFKDPSLWILGSDEAALVDLMIGPDYRGRGLAPILIAQASTRMFSRGCTRLYAWIWHNHTASIRAFERAGWMRIALIMEFRLFGLSRVILRFPRKSRALRQKALKGFSIWR
jgi:ribosomal protein S18 acetylase RimI-like enzyme